MNSTVISLAVAAALAALLVGASMLLAPEPDPVSGGADNAAPLSPAPPPDTDTGTDTDTNVAALDAAPLPILETGAAPVSRQEAEARLEQIESQLEAMEDQVAALENMSEQEEDAFFDRVEPLLEQLAEAELALEAAIEAENGIPSGATP